MSSKSKTIFVTGVAGFLGSHLSEKLVKDQIEKQKKQTREPELVFEPFQSINYIPTVSTGSFGTLNVKESFIGDGKNLDNILPSIRRFIIV